MRLFTTEEEERPIGEVVDLISSAPFVQYLVWDDKSEDWVPWFEAGWLALLAGAQIYVHVHGHSDGDAENGEESDLDRICALLDSNDSASLVVYDHLIEDWVSPSDVAWLASLCLVEETFYTQHETDERLRRWNALRQLEGNLESLPYVAQQVDDDGTMEWVESLSLTRFSTVPPEEPHPPSVVDGSVDSLPPPPPPQTDSIEQVPSLQPMDAEAAAPAAVPTQPDPPQPLLPIPTTELSPGYAVVTLHPADGSRQEIWLLRGTVLGLR